MSRAGQPQQPAGSAPVPLVAPASRATAAAAVALPPRPEAVYVPYNRHVVVPREDVAALTASDQSAVHKLVAVVFDELIVSARTFSEYVPTRKADTGFNTEKHFKSLLAFSLAGVTLVDDQRHPLDNPYGTVLSKLSYGQFPFQGDCFLFDMRLNAPVSPRDLEVVTSYLIQHKTYLRLAKDGNGFVLLNPAKHQELKDMGFDVQAILDATFVPEKEEGTHGVAFEPCALADLPKDVSWSDSKLGGSTDARAMGDGFIVKGCDIPTHKQRTFATLQLHGEFLGARALEAAGLRVPTTAIRQKDGAPVLLQQRISNGTPLALALTGEAQKDAALWQHNLEALLPSILIGDTDRLGLCLANSYVPNAPNGNPDREAAPAFFDFGATGFMRAGGFPKRRAGHTHRLRDEFNADSVLGQLVFHLGAKMPSKPLFDRWTPAQMADAIDALAAKVPAIQDALRGAHDEWNALQIENDPVQTLQGDAQEDHSGASFADIVGHRMNDLQAFATQLRALPTDRPTSDIALGLAEEILTKRQAA